MNSIVAKIAGGLLGVMRGDGLGMPVETMSREEILSATGGKGITTFVDPIQTKFASMRALKAGDTTDDWQFTDLVASSLIRNDGGYDQIDMANAHIEAYHASTNGWGGTTRESIKELALYKETQGKKGRSPMTPPLPREGRGAGNGIAIKISPIAYLHAVRYPTEVNALELINWTRHLTILTHSHPNAMWTAYALACVIIEAMHKPIVTHKDSLGVLSRVMHEIEFVTILNESDEVLLQLEKVAKRIGNVEALTRDITPGFTAITSVPFAIGIALSFPGDFKTALLEAVNAGGDADSTASMVGSIVGANVGYDGIPSELRELHDTETRAMELAEELFRVAT